MLFVLKIFLLVLIFITASLLGFLFANQYSKRIAELEDFYKALGLFETKIAYTYDELIDTFVYIAENLTTKIYRIFFITAEKLRENPSVSAGDSFRSVVEDEKIFLALKPNDIEVIKSLSVSLGQMDIDSQMKNIQLVKRLVEKELNTAYEEKKKNFKVYRSMGVMGGMVLMILLL